MDFFQKRSPLHPAFSDKKYRTPCTEYGICSAAARLVRAIFHDTKEIIPCSCELSGEYGVKGVFTGCPAVIGADGAEKPVELRLTEEELDEFRRCCDTIKANYQKALKI